jgi:hypothetical protein
MDGQTLYARYCDIMLREYKCGNPSWEELETDDDRAGLAGG